MSNPSLDTRVVSAEFSFEEFSCAKISVPQR